MPPSRLVQSGLVSQLPFLVLVGAWFLINRGLVLPRALRLLDAEYEVAQSMSATLS